MKHAAQRYWDAVQEGESLAPLEFPITVYRLVMAAGANRDFNAIHHNAEYARMTGAPDMYANNFFLQGMWERTVRDYIGLGGSIRSLRGFRMRSFNVPGETLRVTAKVLRKWRQADEGWTEIQIQTENSQGVTVGPGSVLVTLPVQSP